MVNEAGASIYSASEVAREEFPDKDITVRGAVSIARRLQDPLAELVKIEPKSIGVGQYQHDVDQFRLGKSLDGVVEDAVNAVGVDLNTASAPPNRAETCSTSSGIDAHSRYDSSVASSWASRSPGPSAVCSARNKNLGDSSTAVSIACAASSKASPSASTAEAETVAEIEGADDESRHHHRADQRAGCEAGSENGIAERGDPDERRRHPLLDRDEGDACRQRCALMAAS
mgnify:CR=1 FL=1